MLAENIESGEKCALKIMKNGKGKDYEQIQHMLKVEVSNLKELSHTNILKVFDYSDKEVFINSRKSKIDVSYIAMEYAENGEFFDYIAGSDKFSEKTARYYFHQLIEALEHVHESGMAHRDIKPENLMLDTNFNLKLGDFGFCTKDKISWTKRGTVGYMAPEIIAGFKYDPKKSDLFSAAVILFIMITQHCPFVKADPNDKYYKKLIKSSYSEFWSLHPDSEECTKDFKDLFCKMTSVIPGHRLTIEEIKEHSWYNGPLPSQKDVEFEFILRRKSMLINTQSHEVSDEKLSKNEDLTEFCQSSEVNENSESTTMKVDSESDEESTKIKFKY